jgi:hypothetical protein
VAEIEKKKSLREQGFETVVAAAIKFGAHKIAVGYSHSDHDCRSSGEAIPCTDMNLEHLWTYGDDGGLNFGYYTSNGRFCRPGDAWRIAEKNGLMGNVESPQSFTRYSEDYFAIGSSEYDIPYAKKLVTQNIERQKAKTKRSLVDAVFEPDKNTKNQKLNEFVTDYFDRLEYLKQTSDGKEVIEERLNEVIRW